MTEGMRRRVFRAGPVPALCLAGLLHHAVVRVPCLPYHSRPPPVPLQAPGVPQSLTPSVGGSTVSLAWMPPATGGSPASYVLEAGSAQGLSNLTVVVP